MGGYIVSGSESLLISGCAAGGSSSKRIVRPVEGGGVRNVIGRNLVRAIGYSDGVDNATWVGVKWTENADVSMETQSLRIVDNGSKINEEICEGPKTVAILELDVCENGSNHTNVCDQDISNETNSIVNSSTECR